MLKNKRRGIYAPRRQDDYGLTRTYQLFVSS
ncbi:hypothetical protein JOH51_001925 [Rhizobium leguminosarum]|nr:hypothetical protein [Rhizobium leguminosarum]